MPMILSLWKVSNGGRSFKRVEALLASYGIACVKTGEVSQWEGRYEIAVHNDDAAQAQHLLMTHVESFEVQALDVLSDRT